MKDGSDYNMVTAIIFNPNYSIIDWINYFKRDMNVYFENSERTDYEFNKRIDYSMNAYNIADNLEKGIYYGYDYGWSVAEDVFDVVGILLILVIICQHIFHVQGRWIFLIFIQQIHLMLYV